MRKLRDIQPVTALALVMMLGITSSAVAQDSSQEASQNKQENSNPQVMALDEIIVTSRRRSESLQEVPVAISVFSATTIESARVEQVADFIALTPGATFRENFSPSFANLTVRGITTQQNGELPIAVSVDGVTLPSTSFLNQDLLDVEQVEVLKGPQGGLYGRNAIAGAVNITTRRPGEELEGRVRATYGNGDYKQVQGVVSGPLAEGLYGKVGVSYKDSAGKINSALVDDKLDPVEEFTVYGRLIWDASENLSVDLRAKFTDGEMGVSYFDAVPVADIEKFDNDPLISHPAVNKRKLYEITGKADYTAEFGTFTSITSYFDVEDKVTGDTDFGVFGPPEQWQDFQTLVSGWSQEFRFASPDEQEFRWLVGAFYQNRTVETFTDVLEITDDGDLIPLFLVEDSANDSESWAIFGQAAVDVTDALELSVALRYDQDKRTTVDRAASAETFSDTYSKFQPKVSLSYDLSDDTMLYATWGKGFRSGGFNGFAVGPEFQIFDGEVSTTYELGFKGSMSDGRVRMNAAIYHIDFSNQQFFFFPDEFTSLIQNADKTKIDGAELEFTALVSEGLSLIANFGYVHTEITANAPDAFGDTFVGNTSPGVNEYTVNLAVDYTVAHSGDLEWSSRVDYERRGPIYYEFNNFHRTTAKNLINLRTAIQTDIWSIAAFMRNATDERYPLTAEAFLGADTVFRLPSSKRFYGVEASYRF